MDIDNIKKMTDRELGYQISLLLGYTASSQWCEEICSSLDRCAEVEKIVVEKVSQFKYGEALLTVQTDGKFSIKPQIEFIVDHNVRGHYAALTARICLAATADARTRAEACFLALSEYEEKEK